MKKTIAIFFSVLICISFAACAGSEIANSNMSAENSINESMPEPFLRDENSGGDELRYYSSEYDIKFTNLSGYMIDLVDENEFKLWADEFFTLRNRDLSEFNILSFVTEFNIPKNDLLKILNNHYGYEGFYITTREEVDIIYSDDNDLIKSYFVSDYSLLYNGEIYTPEWFYTHTVNEYLDENLPLNEVLATFEKFTNLPFTEEAMAALDRKVKTFESEKNSELSSTNKSVEEESGDIAILP